jgi:RNA polymerase sigma factor (sigma-70 family)
MRGTCCDPDAWGGADLHTEVQIRGATGVLQSAPMLHLASRSPVAAHEDVFLARYRALVLVALRVTDGNRAEAEDLVQEAFVRFTLVQPPLDDVRDLDAYLSRMLRNMYTSRIRRRLRAAETSLSILDYDSLDIGLHVMDASRQLEVRDLLRAACEYGCLRRRSSKTGSVFLLRFFHGYLPGEIASLTRLSSAIVDALVFRARREVRAYVEDPDQVSFIDRPGSHVIGRAGTPPAGAHQPDRGVMDELRARMFRDPHERCWSKKALRDLYAPGSAEALSRDDVADLVGCPTCLDAAGALLGLPRLADRWPADTLGPGSRGGPPGGAPGGRVESARRRARAVFEHRPRELCVAVNGFTVGTQTIGTDSSDLTLSVNLNEPIASIELLSEQSLCLAFLEVVPPPEGNTRQRRRVGLSDGRYAEIEVTFASPWPSVRASYCDPRPRLSAYAVEELAGEDEGRPAQAQVALEHPVRPRRLFGWRPAWGTFLVVIAIWLLFWTPGARVSAAARLADAIRWVVTTVLGSDPAGVTRAVAPPRLKAADLSLPMATSPPAIALDPLQRAHLELTTLAELQQVHAYLGQELSFAPGPGATVQLQGLVDTDRRRQMLLAALGPLLRNGALEARITNVNQIRAPSRRPSVAETAPRTFAFTGNRFALFAEVRRYVTVQQQVGPLDERSPDGAPIVDDADLDARTHRFAAQVLDRSRRASQHAWALKHLGERLPAALIGAASPDTRELWRAVVREHARAYGQEIALLRRELEAAIPRPGERAEGDTPADLRISTDDGGADWTDIVRLHAAHGRQDQSIQNAFAIQSGSSAEAPGVATEAFWTLMDACETSAARLARDTAPSR